MKGVDEEERIWMKEVDEEEQIRMKREKKNTIYTGNKGSYGEK
jgi:hypothetical protein